MNRHLRHLLAGLGIFATAALCIIIVVGGMWIVENGSRGIKIGLSAATLLAVAYAFGWAIHRADEE